MHPACPARRGQLALGLDLGRMFADRVGVELFELGQGGLQRLGGGDGCGQRVQVLLHLGG